MITWTRWSILGLTAAVLAWGGASGCSKQDGKKEVAAKKDGDQTPKVGDQKKDGDHKEHKDGHVKAKDGHKDKSHDDHDKAITLKDIKVPGSFKDGVARLEELQKHVHHLLEDNKLDKVHRAAEEMALVAIETKKMAQKEVAADQLVNVGRWTNEVSSAFTAIDAAADMGKKKEAEEIHNKVGKAIEQLKTLVK